MANFSRNKLAYGLTASVELTKSRSRGEPFVGSSGTIDLPETGGTTKTYVITATFATPSDTLTIDPETGIATPGTLPVGQVETATAAGTIGTSGNATVVVTAARVTGSPVTLSVPVLSGDTANDWAAKVRAALTANAAISAVYTVSGAGASIVLTETDPENNDGTLNISLANGTCTGITAAPSSANTTAGVGGVKLTGNTGDGKDMEGISLGTMDIVYAIQIVNVGSEGEIEASFGSTFHAGLALGGVASVGQAIGSLDWASSGTIEATAAPAEVEITITARQAAA